MAGPLSPSAKRTDEGIEFTWVYSKHQQGARGDDRVIALGYDPESELGYYRIGEGAVRGDEAFLRRCLTAGKNSSWKLIWLLRLPMERMAATVSIWENYNRSNVLRDKKKYTISARPVYRSHMRRIGYFCGRMD